MLIVKWSEYQSSKSYLRGETLKVPFATIQPVHLLPDTFATKHICHEVSETVYSRRRFFDVILYKMNNNSSTHFILVKEYSVNYNLFYQGGESFFKTLIKLRGCVRFTVYSHETHSTLLREHFTP